MKCDLCGEKQGYRNYLRLENIIAGGGQIARACRSCKAALDEGIRLEDEFGFVWQRVAGGNLRCRHKEATNE